MLGKLIIIGIIIATVVLVPTLGKMISPSSFSALEDKIDKATSDHLDNNSSTLQVMEEGGKLANTINSSLSQKPISIDPSSLYELSSQYVNKQNYTGQVFEKNGNTCEISVPDMAQMINGQKELTHIIELNQCTLNPGEPVKITSITTKPNSPFSPSSGIQVTPFSTGSSDPSLPTLPPYYKIVHLDAQNQGSNAIIDYQDSTGKTNSVTVTMKSSDKILFSGTFYSSKFSTEVKDIPNTPHVIELLVDNSEYGKLHASVYAPFNIQNSTITGIFTQ